MLTRRNVLAGAAGLVALPAAAQEREWKLIAHTGVAAVDTETGVRVSSDGPGFAHFRSSRGGKLSRFHFAGRSHGGLTPPTLSVAFDGQWIANIFSSITPYEFEVSPETLDVYLTVVAPTDFSLDVRVTACSFCKTNSDLRDLILDARPELAAAVREERHLDAASILMDWGANNSVWNVSDAIQDASNAYLSLPIGQLYFEHLRNGSVAYVCGGQAYWLIELCKLFDLPALSIHAGTQSDFLTHAFVVVPIKVVGGYEFYLMDPSFNAILLHQKRPAPLNRYFTSSREDWSFDARPMPGRRFLAAMDDPRLVASPPATQITTRGVRGAVFGATEGARLFEDFVASWGDRLIRNGFPTANPHWQLALIEHRVFGVWYPTDPAFTDVMLRFLRAHGIRTGNGPT